MHLNTKKKIKQQIENWINNWITIICELISILTLAFYRPFWDLDFLGWLLVRETKAKNENK